MVWSFLDFGFYTCFECSECHYRVDTTDLKVIETYHYCPYCGAEMREEEDE